MKKKMLDYYKPSRDMTKGAALQITRTENGINLQLARQATAMDMKNNRNATFDWQYNSFSATLKVDELAKLSTHIKKAEAELRATMNANKLAEAGVIGKMQINTESLGECRFPHLNSTTPKTISAQLNEYPKGSGELTMRLSIRGTMGYRDQGGQFVKKENESIMINLKEHEFRNLLLVVESEISNQLEDNLISCTVVNQTVPDSRDNIYGGYKTINQIRLPAMNPGEKIINLRKDLVLVIKEKFYDVNTQKMVYFCEQL